MVVMIIFFVIVAIVAAWLISAYNRLIALKGQTANAWKQIDVQLKRRHDLIPNLVNAAKGAMQFEKQTLETVVTARNAAASAIASSTPETASKVAAAEGVLTAALGRFNAIVEAYPDLKATGNIGQLQEELASTENRVAFARQAYNDTATVYNITQSQFPTMLVTGLASANKVELWEITDEADKAVPAVDLSMK
jgi:LemA protein